MSWLTAPVTTYSGVGRARGGEKMSYSQCVLLLDDQITLGVLATGLCWIGRRHASHDPAECTKQRSRLIRLIDVLTEVATCEHDPPRARSLERHTEPIPSPAGQLTWGGPHTPTSVTAVGLGGSSGNGGRGFGMVGPGPGFGRGLGPGFG